MKRLLKRMARQLIAPRPGPTPAAPAAAYDFGSYTVHMGTDGSAEGADPFAQSPVRPLYTPKQMMVAVEELRRMLAEDASPRTVAALQSEVAKEIERFRGHWFQRIAYPAHHLTSTSDHSWAYIDEGGLNTLGKRLSSEEASILRPWPKWMYLRPLLPELRGKSVLELGSSNGFFCFQFAERGAAQVTGVEVIRSQYESAVWSAGVLGLKNVQFRHGDGLLDLSLPAHDVVFMSEVHNHLVCPFFGLLRMVNLARETVIFDTGAVDSRDLNISLHTAWRKESGHLIYHSYMLTDGFIMTFLKLIGVSPNRVTRYKAPPHEYHILYVIDTRGLDEHRRRLNYPEYLDAAIRLRFQTGAV